MDKTTTTITNSETKKRSCYEHIKLNNVSKSIAFIITLSMVWTKDLRHSNHCIIYVFKGYLFFPVYNICLVICRTHLHFKPKFCLKSQLTHCFVEKVCSGNYVVHNAPEVVGETSNF